MASLNQTLTGKTIASYTKDADCNGYESISIEFTDGAVLSFREASQSGELCINSQICVEYETPE